MATRRATRLGARGDAEDGLPFDDVLLSELVGSGIRSALNGTVQDWADEVAVVYVHPFLQELLGNPALHKELTRWLGPTFDAWQKKIPRVVNDAVDQNEDADPEAGSLRQQAETRILQLIRTVATASEVPGARNSTSRNEKTYRHANAYRLILTILLDLQENPTGYFQTKLGGAPLRNFLADETPPKSTHRGGRPHWQKHHALKHFKEARTTKRRSEDDDEYYAKQDTFDTEPHAETANPNKKARKITSRPDVSSGEEDDEDFQLLSRADRRRSNKTKNQRTQFIDDASDEVAVNGHDTDASDEIQVASTARTCTESAVPTYEEDEDEFIKPVSLEAPRRSARNKSNSASAPRSVIDIDDDGSDGSRMLTRSRKGTGRPIVRHYDVEDGDESEPAQQEAPRRSIRLAKKFINVDSDGDDGDDDDSEPVLREARRKTSKVKLKERVPFEQLRAETDSDGPDTIPAVPSSPEVSSPTRPRMDKSAPAKFIRSRWDKTKTNVARTAEEREVALGRLLEIAESEREKAKATITQLRAKMTKSGTKKLEDELVVERAKVRRLEGEMRTVNEEVTKMKGKFAAVETKNKTVLTCGSGGEKESSHSEAGPSVTQLLIERRSHEARAESLKADWMQHVEKIQKLEFENAGLRSQTDTVSNELQIAKTKLAAAETKFEKLEAEITSVRSRPNPGVDDLETTKAQLAAADIKAEKLDSEAAKLRVEVAMGSDELKRMRTKLEIAETKTKTVTLPGELGQSVEYSREDASALVDGLRHKAEAWYEQAAENQKLRDEVAKLRQDLLSRDL